jgi:hypothetical protein
MRTKEELIKIIGKYGLGDAERLAAKAELEAMLAQESTQLIQKMRENIYEALAGFGSEVVRLRDAVNGASNDASSQSRTILGWTRVLAIATVALVAVTGALVWATLQLVPR